jgi:hypothetical protein
MDSQAQDKEYEFHLPMAKESQHDKFDWWSHQESEAYVAMASHVLHVDVREGVDDSYVCCIEGNSPFLQPSVAESEEICQSNEHMPLPTYVSNLHLQSTPLPLFYLY